MKKFYVYLARCRDRTLYTGYCIDLAAREAKHNAGEGASYTRSRRPVKIVYSEEYDSKADAMRRERQIKKWLKIKKEHLLKNSRAVVAQLVEHVHGKDGVRGSIPRNGSTLRQQAD